MPTTWRSSRAAAEWDEADLSVLLSSLYPEVVVAVTLHVGSRTIAEDAAQEALVRLWLQRTEVRNPRAWVFRCAFNFANSAFRRRAREVLEPPKDRAQRVDSDSVSQRLDVLKGLSNLSRRQREAVILRYLCDMSVDDVAAVMTTKSGTVKAHLARALNALRSDPTFRDAISVEDVLSAEG